MRAALRAVALRQGFLGALSNGEIVVAAAIDAVVFTVFQAEDDSEAAWQLLRDETLVLVIEVVLDAVASFGLSEDIIDKAREVIQDLVEQLTTGGGFSIDALKRQLNDALEGVV